MIILYSQDNIKVEYEVLPEAKSFCNIQKKGCVGIVRLHIQLGLVLNKNLSIELTYFKKVLKTILETLGS